MLGGPCPHFMSCSFFLLLSFQDALVSWLDSWYRTLDDKESFVLANGNGQSQSLGLSL